VIAEPRREPGVVDSIYLHPGEMAFCDRPTLVETVLGSCVSVIMRNPRLQLGCICHAMLPCSRGDRREPLKYVDSSIRCMLQMLARHSSRKEDLEVKLFGGASMGRLIPRSQSVGHQNVEAAMTLVHEEGLKVRTSDTGGTSGRKLLFYTATGEVLVKRIPMEAGG